MKRHIAIVCGGDSSEHDVSLRSAQGIYSFIDKRKYEVHIVELRHTDWRVVLKDGSTASVDLNDFSYMEGDKRRYFDYAYITIHGTPGENGILQGYFDLVGIPYSTGSVLVEALTFDKFALIQYLRSFGVRVADSLLIRRDQEDNIVESEIVSRIGMPCFVKPSTNGSSFGISKVKNFDQLAPALRNAMMESDSVMVEQYLKGVEITVGCYKTRTKSVVFPITEIVSKNEFFDYDAKYNGSVDEITPARIAKETAERAQQLTSAIYDILHCNGIIRIDYIITSGEDGKDKINLIEINTTPGMTEASLVPQQIRAAGLNISDVFSDIIENQL